MNIVDDPLYFGSYIGQHKISKKCPMKDGYKGSGSDWKKYILQKGIHTEKAILRLCDSIEEANYWEDYYIEKAREEGIYLWNRCKGGGGYEHDRIYTDEEIKQHKMECDKQYYEEHKEALSEQHKQYYEEHKEALSEQHKQYYEEHKEEIAEYKKQYKNQYKEEIAEYNKQYKNQLCQYNGETLTLTALSNRFGKAGVKHPTIEAKKYLVSDTTPDKDNIKEEINVYNRANQ